MYISAYYFGQSMVDDALDRSDTRRLQITGGSTYIVSLPKRWVVQHGLVAKDEVRIEWRPSGTLRIIPEGSSVRKRREVEILLDELPEVVILDHLIAAYLAGAQLIRIQTMTGFTRDHRRIFRKFVQSTRGVEIANESDRIIEMVTLLSPSEMPIHSSINRMYLLISSQIRDIVEVLSGGDQSILDDTAEREREVDALRLLLERQIGQILESSRIEDTLGTSRWEAAEIGNIVRTLERMGDHTYNMSKLLIEQNVPRKLSVGERPLSVIPIWQNSIKSLIANLRRHDVKQIHDAKSALTSAGVRLQEFEASLWEGVQGTQEALFLDKLSESLRRLCAYSVDMAEILLNIDAHRNASEVTI